MIMINESKAASHMLYKPPKMHSYNKKVSNNNNKQQQLLSPVSQAPTTTTTSSQVANSVMIIHQNNSISTNCDSNMMTTSTPTKTVLNKPDETTTTTTRSTANSMVLNGDHHDLDELKYMKGYVNVLKERFTRKTIVENEKNGCGATTTTASSGSMEHILHRRSISPYALSKSSSPHGMMIKSSPMNPKLFTSSDDLRNPVKIVVTNNSTNSSSTNNGSLVKNKIKYLSNTALHTAVSHHHHHHHHHGSGLVSPPADFKSSGGIMLYDKISRDEMPKPNFVSAVKNLFEKQIHNHNAHQATTTTACSSSSLNNSLNASSNHVDFNKLNSSFNNNNTAVSTTTPPTPPVVTAVTAKNTTASSCSSSSAQSTTNQYDISLVDRLRQNGTVVYEHADTTTNSQSNGVEKQQQHATPLVSNPPFNHKSANNSSSGNSTKLFAVTNSSKSKPPAPPPPPPSQQPQTPPSSSQMSKKSPLLPSNSSSSSTTIHSHHHNSSSNDSDKENNDNGGTTTTTTTNNIVATSNNDSNRYLTIKERKEFFSKPSSSSSSSSSSSTVQPGRLQKRFKSSCESSSSNGSVANDWSTKTTSEIPDETSSLLVTKPVNNSKSSSSESQLMIEDAHSNETADYDLVAVGDQIDTPTEFAACQNGDVDDENSISANQILTSAKQKKETSTKSNKTNVKMKTFFGGEEIKNLDELKSMKMPVTTSSNTATVRGVNHSSIELFNFEFIGAEVKLEKSILIVRRQQQESTTTTATTTSKRFKKAERVNFVDDAPETYEYPSFEFMLKEMGIDPASDPDYQIVPGTESDQDDQDNHHHNDDDDDLESSNSKKSSQPSYTQFLPGINGGLILNDSSSSDYDDTIKNNTYSKLGSFTNFKPSCLTTSYELGSIEAFEKRLSSTSGSLNGGGHYEHYQMIKSSCEYDQVESSGKDILPSRDEDLKRWSCEMDANILF